MSDDWYIDYRQNKRLRGLEDDLSHVSASLASARSSQRRLHAELSKVQGSLEQRIDRLSAAFDAFVEISDLRVTLGLFDAQGRVRHRARRLLAGVAPDEPLSDVDGYWLAPALVALDPTAPPSALETALARDAHRAGVFHVLATGLLGGRETVTAAMLADVVPAPDPLLPLHQRAAWTLAVDGFFGEAGRELVRRRGAEFVRGLDGSAEAAAVEAVLATGTERVRPVPVSRNFDGITDLTAALDAGARLAALREQVDEVLAGGSDGPPAEPDPIVRRALELLVDEGSPVELPLLARERELRAVIEGGAEPPAWDGPAGETLALIHADAADAGRSGRRAAAVRMCAAHLLAEAQRLAERAGQPFPESVLARTSQGMVPLSADGPGSLDAAHRRIEVAARVSGQRRVTAWCALGAAAVLLVLAVTVGWGWAVGAVAALGVAAFQWRSDVHDRAEASAQAQRAREGLAAELDQRVAELDRARSTLTGYRSRVDADLAALRAALA